MTNDEYFEGQENRVHPNITAALYELVSKLPTIDVEEVSIVGKIFSVNVLDVNGNRVSIRGGIYTNEEASNLIRETIQSIIDNDEKPVPPVNLEAEETQEPKNEYIIFDSFLRDNPGVMKIIKDHIGSPVKLVTRPFPTPEPEVVVPQVNLEAAAILLAVEREHPAEESQTYYPVSCGCGCDYGCDYDDAPEDCVPEDIILCSICIDSKSQDQDQFIYPCPTVAAARSVASQSTIVFVAKAIERRKII